ncbi:hypothetical protein C0J52_01317 [Blattella germanica]|nr:hypothetical protein C0J52_01317 [Blattella germanica]
MAIFFLDKMEANSEHMLIEHTARKMDSTVLDCFTALGNNIEKTRIDAGIKLLDHVYAKQSEFEEEGLCPELLYTLKRLVCGVASSRVSARKGFFTALVGLLSSFSNVTVDDVMKILQKELHARNVSKSEEGDIYAGHILVYGALVRSGVLLKSSGEVQTQTFKSLLEAGAKRSYLLLPAHTFLIDLLEKIEEESFRAAVWPVIKENVKPLTEESLETFHFLLLTRLRFPEVVKKKFLINNIGTRDVINEDSLQTCAKLLMVLCMLTPRVVNMVIKSLEKLSKKLVPKTDRSCNRVHEVFAVYLLTTLKEADIKDKTIIKIIRKFCFECGTKIIQNLFYLLKDKSVKKVTDLFVDVVSAASGKKGGLEGDEPRPWNVKERMYASDIIVRLLGMPCVMAEMGWKTEQTKFLLHKGFFHPQSQEKSDIVVGGMLVDSMRQNFFRVLNQRVPKMEDVRVLLSTLVHHVNKMIAGGEQLLRQPLTGEVMESWKKLIETSKNLEQQVLTGKNPMLARVFHTMFSFMGLQLLADPKLAEDALGKEQKEKRRKQREKKDGEEEQDEPEWVEVAVDLILSLLSQTSTVPKNLLDMFFFHLCPHLTGPALGQIIQNEEDESEDDSEEEDDDKGNDDDDSSEDKESEEDSMSDSDESEQDNEENETVNDKLRMAESVDIDEMDEEEGRRLDQALSDAFRLYKTSKSNKKAKKQIRDDRILMHFRIRIVDLLEIYLKSEHAGTEASLASYIDIMLALFNLLEFCIRDAHQKPLENRVRACLKRLSSARKNLSLDGVTQEILADALKRLLEKGEKTTGPVFLDMGNKIAECCSYLVRCSQRLPASDQNVSLIVEIYKNALTNFFRKRDCLLQPAVFTSVLQTAWEGNWTLVPLLVQYAFDPEVRPFRQHQALTWLVLFFRNGRFRTLENTDEKLKEVERLLSKKSIEVSIQLLNLFQAYVKGKDKGLKPKFLQLLFNLFFAIFRLYGNDKKEDSGVDWTAIGERMLAYREKEPVQREKKEDVNASVSDDLSKKDVEKMEADSDDNDEDSSGEEMETDDDDHSDDDDGEKETVTKKPKEKKKQKRKRQNVAKLKKKSRDLRLASMSEGLESITFSGLKRNAEVDDDHSDSDVDSSDDSVHNGLVNGESRQKEVQKRKAFDSEENRSCVFEKFNWSWPGLKPKILLSSINRANPYATKDSKLILNNKKEYIFSPRVYSYHTSEELHCDIFMISSLSYNFSCVVQNLLLLHLRFPKDTDRRQQWIKALRRENWTPTSNSLLCSSHFKETDFDRTSLCVVRIRDEAVPSIFPEYLKPKGKGRRKIIRSEISVPMPMEVTAIESPPPEQESSVSTYDRPCKMEPIKEEVQDYDEPKTSISEEDVKNIDLKESLPVDMFVSVKMEPQVTEEFIPENVTIKEEDEEDVSHDEYDTTNLNEGSRSCNNEALPSQEYECVHNNFTSENNEKPVLKNVQEMCGTFFIDEKELAMHKKNHIEIKSILFRCVTFVLNAFVIRHVSQSVVGVMNVRLLLLESTILFLSREAFRRACLSKTTEHNWTQVINLLWITVPLCQFFSLVFGYIWLHVLTPPSIEITEHYAFGVYAICLSCVIEMICEPVYLVAQAFLFVRFKVVMDTIHIFVRTFIFTPLIFFWPKKAVVAFSLAQVIAAVVYTLGYYVYFYYYIKKLKTKHKKGNVDEKSQLKNEDSVIESEDDFPFESLFDVFPSKIEDGPSIDYSLAKLTWSFFKQGILKQVLTEGERYIMTMFSLLSFSEQGVYDIVNNLGSLAARFLFRPIEDSSYFYFSQMVGRDASIQEQNQRHMNESSNVLHQVLRCITCIGMVILVFGQSYSMLLLYLYGGQSLISGPGPMLMRTHCLAVLLLAVNGITECYSFATMNTVQLDRHNYRMAVLSMSFLVVSWALTRMFGGVGFILANCCNMAARIVQSIQFIRQRYQNTQYKPLRGLIPGPYFLVVLFLAGIITQLSEGFLFQWFKLLHLGIGMVCFAAVLASWAYEEQELVSLAMQKWQAKKQD